MEPAHATGSLWRLMTPADRILIAVLLIACGVSLVWSRGTQQDGGTARVEVDGQLVGVYALDRERTLDVQGAVGRTVLRLGGGQVRVESAPCQNQLCRQQGPISRRGQILVCVPNRVVVSVGGTAARADVDAVVR